MRFTLAQLKKISMPYSYNETIDLSSDLNGLEDIIKSSPCDVSSTIMNRGDDTYKINFKIKIVLTLEDAISLKQLDYPIEIDAEEIFSNDESDEDAFLIDGITLDTKEAIVANILINKPMSTTFEEFESDEDLEEENETFSSCIISSWNDYLSFMW